MNTQLAFAFGVLAVIAIIMLVAIVVGIVKVLKQQDKITSLEKWIDDTNRFMENNRQEIERRVTEEVRILADEIGQVHRLMDSRFDKFEDKITKKQILKD